MKPYIIEPTEFKPFDLGFSSCDLKSFDTMYGFILWCSIKGRCITDQHFDSTISGSAEYYYTNLPDNFMEFRDRLYAPLRKYITDDSFMLMIYNLLKDPYLVTYTIKGETYKLTDFNLKLFKPEKYI